MITVRRMTPADLDFGMMLKQQAGWNQTLADWQRHLRLQEDGCFLAEWNGQPAGTVVAILFESVAWIAMMLVEASLRGRGIGRALMEHALAFADEQGAITVRLDATALGQPLYERLGFEPDYVVIRYAGQPKDASPSPAEPLPVTVEQILPLDHEATGCRRRRLLEALWEVQPGWGILHQGQAQGFYTARPGSAATQIGPCIGDAQAGPLLLRDAFWRYRGQPVFIDLPEANQTAQQLTQTAGLTEQRRLVRMTRGPRVPERREWLWASSGPENG